MLKYADIVKSSFMVKQADPLMPMFGSSEWTTNPEMGDGGMLIPTTQEGVKELYGPKEPPKPQKPPIITNKDIWMRGEPSPFGNPEGSLISPYMAKQQVNRINSGIGGMTSKNGFWNKDTWKKAWIDTGRGIIKGGANGGNILGQILLSTAANLGDNAVWHAPKYRQFMELWKDGLSETNRDVQNFMGPYENETINSSDIWKNLTQNPGQNVDRIMTATVPAVPVAAGFQGLGKLTKGFWNRAFRGAGWKDVFGGIVRGFGGGAGAQAAAESVGNAMAPALRFATNYVPAWTGIDAVSGLTTPRESDSGITRFFKGLGRTVPYITDISGLSNRFAFNANPIYNGIVEGITRGALEATPDVTGSRGWLPNAGLELLRHFAPPPEERGEAARQAAGWTPHQELPKRLIYRVAGLQPMALPKQYNVGIQAMYGNAAGPRNAMIKGFMGAMRTPEVRRQAFGPGLYDAVEKANKDGWYGTNLKNVGYRFRDQMKGLMKPGDEEMLQNWYSLVPPEFRNMGRELWKEYTDPKYDNPQKSNPAEIKQIQKANNEGWTGSNLKNVGQQLVTPFKQDMTEQNGERIIGDMKGLATYIPPEWRQLGIDLWKAYTDRKYDNPQGPLENLGPSYQYQITKP